MRSDGLKESLGRILEAALRVHQDLELKRRRNPLAELSRGLGLDFEILYLYRRARFVTLLLPLCAWGRPTQSPLQQELQDALLDALPESEDRLLLRQLWAEPLRACRIIQGRDALELEALSGLKARSAIDTMVAIETGEARPPGDYLGWIISWGGPQIFLAAEALEEESRALIEAIEVFPLPMDEPFFWGENLPELVCAALDPTHTARRRRRTPFVTEQALRPSAYVRRDSYSPTELLRLVVITLGYALKEGYWGYNYSLTRRRYPREIIARARSTEDLSALDQLMVEHRAKLLHRAGALADQPHEAHLPLARIRQGFGLQATGADLVGLSHDLVLSWPARLLLLPEKHPLFEQLHPSEPIRALRALAQDTPDFKLVEDALKALEDEVRWRATFQCVDLLRLRHLEQIDFADLHHALTHLFHPQVLRTPLATLGLSKGDFGRLERGLAEGGEKPELLLSDLPSDEEGLEQLSFVGAQTVLMLKRALLEFLEGWRATLVGLDPKALGSSTITDRGPDGQDAIREGLAALEDLLAGLE